MSKFRNSRHIRALVYAFSTCILLLLIFFTIDFYRASKSNVPKSYLQKVNDFVWGSTDGNYLISSYNLQDQIALAIVVRKNGKLDKKSVANLKELSSWIEKSLSTSKEEIWTPKKIRKILIFLNQKSGEQGLKPYYEIYELNSKEFSVIEIKSAKDFYAKSSKIDFYILNNQSRIELRTPLEDTESFSFIKKKLSSLVSKQNLSYYLEFQSLMWKRNSSH